MCICVNKILNNNVLSYDAKLGKIRIEVLKVLKLAKLNYLDKIKREYYFLSLLHLK